MLCPGFWDPQKARSLDASLFRVAAGKEEFEYEAIENQNDKKFEVDKILYAESFNRATSNYAADIVLVVLKTPIEFRSPICIPYGLKYDETNVPTGWKGRGAGWVKTCESIIECK